MIYENEADERIARLLRDSEQLTEAINRVLREAVARHLQADHPVADWRNNRVVWIAPSNIPLPPSSNVTATSRARGRSPLDNRRT